MLLAEGIIAEIIDHVSEIDIQHGADADKMAEADALLQRQIENRRADGAALGYKGQIPGHGHLGGKAGVEVRSRPNNAHAVRSHDTKPAAIGDVPNLSSISRPCFTDLLASRRNDNGAADLFFDAFADDIGNAMNRRGDNRQVHARLQGGNRFEARLPVHGLYLGLTGSTVPENPPSIRFLINALPMVPAFSLAPTTAT
jgi:hypothetical protein